MWHDRFVVGFRDPVWCELRSLEQGHRRPVCVRDRSGWCQVNGVAITIGRDAYQKSPMKSYPVVRGCRDEVRRVRGQRNLTPSQGAVKSPRFEFPLITSL